MLLPIAAEWSFTAFIASFFSSKTLFRKIGGSSVGKIGGSSVGSSSTSESESSSESEVLQSSLSFSQLSNREVFELERGS